ncbi:MAG: Crp/Fnr family transcriptional regulator [Magnetococcales bacterium]|nr:Crp/Fnr family transcriptional regulator [Magnetococcales bacterium]MBF0113790.1 Crp/Fnr family transcriptional regulator [Magnetococcales bacterium]
MRMWTSAMEIEMSQFWNVAYELLTQPGCRVRRFGNGEILFQHNDDVEAVPLLMNGKVALTGNGASPTHGENYAFTAQAGHWLNVAASFLDPPRYFLTARGVEEGVVLMMERETFWQTLNRAPVIQQSVLRQMAAELANRSMRHQWDQRCSVCRICYYLLRRIPVQQRTSPCTVLLEKRKQDVATSLEMRNETFSRALAAMEREGLLMSQGHRAITVASGELLQNRLVGCRRCNKGESMPFWQSYGVEQALELCAHAQ